MNVVLYEVSSKFDFSNFIDLLVMAILVLFFSIVLKKVYERKQVKLDIKVVRFFCFGAALFLLSLAIIVLFAQLNMYNKVVGAYYRGEYQIVEGYVENFEPMPYNGHSKETFEIKGVEFSYSDYEIQPGYNNTKSHGGVITGDGQHLRIGYVYLNNTYGNLIVLIEEIPD